MAFLERHQGIRPVMGAIARDYKVKAVVGERNLFDIALARFDVGESAFGGQLFDLLQHMRGEVEGDDPAAVRRDGHRGMARSTARIQGVWRFLLLHQLGNPDQILACGMDLACLVLRGCSTKLIVYGLLDVAHGSSPNTACFNSLPCNSYVNT